VRAVAPQRPASAHDFVDLGLQLRAPASLPGNPTGSTQPLAELLQSDGQRCAVSIGGPLTGWKVVCGNGDPREHLRGDSSE
jgi:hypothetical protein